ncbi:MAG TPA: hypothetical protein VH352_01290 [Pseudonocardiaceae bacterium]|jgi:hypothetical protein|nr:hypothetical protein [Pseudonocardiaceae bacterium]
MSVFSVETLLYAVVQRYGWENLGQPGRQITLTRDDLANAELTLHHRTVKLELSELPENLVVIHTRPTQN